MIFMRIVVVVFFLSAILSPAHGQQLSFNGPEAPSALLAKQTLILPSVVRLPPPRAEYWSPKWIDRSSQNTVQQITLTRWGPYEAYIPLKNRHRSFFRVSHDSQR